MSSLQLTANSKQVLEARYLLRDEADRLIESPDELFQRVANAVATADGKAAGKWAPKYLRLMRELRFLPNSPTLMNAGKKGGQLSACFVLPVEDSLDQIFDTLKNAAMIHQSGGGTGFAFSRVRAKGSRVKSSHGIASGPISFMKIYDTATETIKQGGTRRGANMGVLRIDHPDVVEFIDSKRDGRSIINFNISVGVTDEFMTALRLGTPFSLRDPQTGHVVRQVQARELFERLCQSAWECGDPGVVFLDRMNRFNPTPKVGEFESTNPCGEQPLLPYESCNLGSLNLGQYVDVSQSRFNWAEFCEDIHVAVRFLDNVIDVNEYPVSESEKITRRNRKIGLGVMGWADALLKLGIPYGAESARSLGQQIMSVLDREAKTASMGLATERGPFPNWKGSTWDRLGYQAMRNATVSTVAPTGTISMIAGCSSGIEPIFAAVFFRNVLDGARLIDIHPVVADLLQVNGVAKKDWEKGVSDADLNKWIGPAWSPASQVSIEGHVQMQAVFQRFSDSAVSKTINLPQSATVADVQKAYVLAYDQGCKGITVYRDQSRSAQVLEEPRPEPGDKDSSDGEICPIC